MVSENKEDILKSNHARTSWQVLAFALPVLLWLVFDRATKLFFDNSGALPGQLLSNPICGLFQFRLIHNQGAAWGIFSDSTFLLGILSLVICVAIIAYVVVFRHELTLFQIVLLALVFAGGIGNAYDRFAYGYVVDFIEFSFIDFPVFNIADIGVTCGIILYLVSSVVLFVVQEKKEA